MDTSIKAAKNKIKDKLFNPHDKRNLAKRLFGYCDCPYHKSHWFQYPSTIRKNTAYADEESNYITCCEEYYEKEVEPQIDEMWEELADVPFDEVENSDMVLANDWFIFKKGTEREAIWHWFDENHSKGVGYLLYEYESENEKDCR